MSCFLAIVTSQSRLEEENISLDKSVLFATIVCLDIKNSAMFFYVRPNSGLFGALGKLLTQFVKVCEPTRNYLIIPVYESFSQS